MRPIQELVEELSLFESIRHGGMDSDHYQRFLQSYLGATTRLHHPGYLSHQVAAPLTPSALAELIHGVVDNPMALYEMGPAAAAIEMAILDWMLAKVGWRGELFDLREGGAPDAPKGRGVLTHGGSLANLTALIAARDAICPEAWQQGDPGDLAILVSPSSHHSVVRSCSLMGMGKDAVFDLPMDERFLVDPARIEEAHRAAHHEGRRVMAVVASACCTPTGLHDPLTDIGRYCREHDLWFHVDGAHGASALLSKRERHLLDGIELADSMIWDAHKMLATSTLCAALLFRDGSKAGERFAQEEDYLVDGNSKNGIDLIHRTIECTKAPLGVKLFLNLAFFGEEALGKHVEDLYVKTRAFAEMIAKRPGFECPWVPESNVVCFRYGKDNELQTAIRGKLLDDGTYYLSSAELGGQRYLRVTLMNHATQESHFRELLDEIERYALELSNAP